MGLFENIKDIQREYNQYQYIEHKLKAKEFKNDNMQKSFEIMQKINDRKNLLSEILAAAKNNSPEIMENALSKRLEESNNYFANMDNETKNSFNSTFAGSSEKYKNSPEAQSYHMIFTSLSSRDVEKKAEAYENTINALKEKKTNFENAKAEFENNYKSVYEDYGKDWEAKAKEFHTLKEEVKKAEDNLKIAEEKQRIAEEAVRVKREKRDNAYGESLFAERNRLADEKQNYIAYQSKYEHLKGRIEEYDALLKDKEDYKVKAEICREKAKAIKEAEEAAFFMDKGHKSPALKKLMIFKRETSKRNDSLAYALEMFKENDFEDLNVPALSIDEDLKEKYGLEGFLNITCNFSKEEQETITLGQLEELVVDNFTGMKEFVDPRELRYYDDARIALNNALNNGKKLISELDEDEMSELKDALSEEEMEKILNDENCTINDTRDMLDYYIDEANDAAKKYIEKLESELSPEDKEFYDGYNNKVKTAKDNYNAAVADMRKIQKTSFALTLEDEIRQSLKDMEITEANAKWRMRTLAKDTFTRSNFDNVPEELEKIPPREVGKFITDKLASIEDNLTKTEGKIKEFQKDGAEELESTNARNAKYEADSILTKKTNLLRDYTYNNSDFVNSIKGLEASYDNYKQLEADNFKNVTSVKKPDFTNRIKEQAQVYLDKQSINAGSHKNSSHYTDMINALNAVTQLDANDGATFKAALAELETKTQAYIDAKNAQTRLIPSDMRKTRLALAASIMEFAGNSSKSLDKTLNPEADKVTDFFKDAEKREVKEKNIYEEVKNIDVKAKEFDEAEAENDGMEV